MIGLVFSTQPTQPSRSWWQDIPRSLWKATYRWEELSRLRAQKRIEEPTAKRDTPDWQRRWNAAKAGPEGYARVERDEPVETDEREQS